MPCILSVILKLKLDRKDLSLSQFHDDLRWPFPPLCLISIKTSVPLFRNCQREERGDLPTLLVPSHFLKHVPSIRFARTQDTHRDSRRENVCAHAPSTKHPTPFDALVCYIDIVVPTHTTYISLYHIAHSCMLTCRPLKQFGLNTFLKWTFAVPNQHTVIVCLQLNTTFTFSK